jgi:geranylgeranyl diphosphate synthase type II
MTSAPMKEFAESSRKLRRRIDAALDRYADWDEDCPRVLQEAIRHSLLGAGKRLRPMLVLMAAEACGSQSDDALPAACAVEMVHTYSLIHDDLPAMDDDDLRRGRPSCHAKFGEAIAILAGDALLATAFEVMAGDISPPEVAAACCAALATAAGPTALVGGQVDDVNAEFKAGDLAQLESIHRRKTGAMFDVSLRIGGLIAGANAEQLSALDAYGKRLGMAFQIVDDVLDLRGDEVAMGKRLGKDSARGKLTYPSVLGLEESERRACQLVEEACEVLSIFDERAYHLDALAHYVIHRTR